MSNKLGYFGVRVDRRDVPAMLSRVAASYALVDAVPEQMRVKQYGDWTSIVLLGWDFGHVHSWAQCASEVSGTVAVSVFILEGTWAYHVFHRGEHISGMEWYPECYPSLLGDLKRASALLGVAARVQRRYCVGDIRPDPDEEDVDPAQLALLEQWGDRLDAEYRACPGDAYPPWDEWAHVDFAKRIGFVCPDPGEGDVFQRITEAKRKTWPRRPRLSERDTVYRFERETFLRECGLGPQPMRARGRKGR